MQQDAAALKQQFVRESAPLLELDPETKIETQDSIFSLAFVTATAEAIEILKTLACVLQVLDEPDVERLP